MKHPYNDPFLTEREIPFGSSGKTTKPVRRSSTWTRDIFAAVNAAISIESQLNKWLPDGKKRGNEFVALNPTRADTRPGSFSINLHTGAWADFATGDRGGDLISLRAYLDGTSQIVAARRIAEELGVAS